MNSNELDRLLSVSGAAVPPVLPSIVAQRVDETLHSLPERASLVRKSKRLRKMLYAAVSIAILVVALVGYDSSSKETQTNLSKLPVVGSLFPKVELEPVMSSSVTSNGITLTLRDTIYDGNNFSVDYSITSDKVLDGLEMEAEMKMNGVTVAQPGDELLVGAPAYMSFKDEQIDSRNYNGYIEGVLTNYHPGSFRMQLDVTKIGSQSGKWSFDIQVDRTSEVTVIEPNLTKSLSGNISIRMNKLILTPLSTDLSYHYTLLKTRDRTVYGIQLSDENGVIYGDKKFSYGLTGISDIDKLLEEDRSQIFKSVSPQAKYLIVRPYSFKLEDVRAQPVDYKKLIRTPITEFPTKLKPLILQRGEAGKLFITSIEYLKNKTVVHYLTEGNMPSSQPGFAIEDEKGKMLPLNEPNINLNEQLYEQTVEFEPISANDNLTFITRPTEARTYLPELEFRIDLHP
jgi:hypothetical protein